MIKKNIFYYFKWIKEYGIPITGVIFAVLNIYLSTKLSPIISDIKGMAVRIEANENRVDEIASDCKEVKIEIRDELKNIRSRVDNIYSILK